MLRSRLRFSGSLILACFFLACFFLACGHSQDDIEKLNKLWSDANIAFAKGEYAKAHEVAAKVVKQIPFEPSSRILLARCQAKLGNNENAISSLATAADSGWEDAEGLTKLPEFETLKDDQQFQQVLKTMAENRKLEFVLYKGDSLDTAKPAPLIVLFHGRGELPKVQLHFWKEAADQAGLRILALKGTRRLGNVYVWEKKGAKKTWQLDVEAIHKKTQAKIKRVIELHKVSHVILAGFSQGGVAAIEMLYSHLKPRPLGALVFSSAFPRDIKQLAVSEANRPDGQMIVHVGANDTWLEGNRLFAKWARELGEKIEYREWPNIGHEMPPKHTQVILKSVEKILKATPTR